MLASVSIRSIVQWRSRLVSGRADPEWERREVRWADECRHDRQGDL